MRKTVIYSLLLLHLNFSAFIPQFEEVDRRDKNGCKVDDINSLSEFIYEVVLGHKDPTPEDEDNDRARVEHVIKIKNYFSQAVAAIKNPYHGQYRLIAVPTASKEEKLTSVFFEIPSPPPKA